MSKFNGLLNQIEETLLEFNMPVYYGRSFAKSNDEWNYFVFNRQSFSKSGTSRIDINYQYQVHLIMENYINEDLELEVIKALSNLKLKFTGATYTYTTKGGTDMVIEMVTMTFTKTSKGIDL